ncbi:MAG: HAD family hydrolase [Acetobacteraceae bacterium]|nr:HAD family hydrolase [Acetobacteraceae bacterium]
MTQIELVVFDCDGVLVDSEEIACKACAASLHAAGFPVSADEIMARYVGISDAAMLADLEQRYGRAMPPGFAAALHERTLAAFDRELNAVPGVEAALAAINCRSCVASSSAPDRIRRSLSKAVLLHWLEPHIFSATQVEHGKPAPDLFLFAADKMGVLVDRTVVIEDSEAGVQAAIAAGMRAFGFTGGSHCGLGHAARLRHHGAFATFRDMRDLPALLQKLEYGELAV